MNQMMSTSSSRKRRHEGENADDQELENIPIQNGVIDDNDGPTEHFKEAVDEEEQQCLKKKKQIEMLQRNVVEEAGNVLFDFIKKKKSYSDALHAFNNSLHALLLMMGQDPKDPNALQNNFRDETCIYQNIDDVIIMFLGKMPEAAQQMDVHGNYPLHLLCGKCWLSDEIVRKLLGIFPDAAKQKNLKGSFPLHIACYHGRSDDIIMKLIDVYPEAVASRSSFDDMHAFDLACRHVESIQVMKKLLKVYPMTEECNPLLQAIIEKESASEILNLIDNDPRAVKLPGANGSYPLHEACRHISGNEGSVITKLLKVFPQAAKIQDSEGWYPLHLACAAGQPDDVILMLLITHPEAAAYHDSSCLYPLQLVCEYGGSENVLRTLAHIYPAALRSKDDNSKYPIHHLICNDRSLEIIQFFINQDPSVKHQADEYGRTPLHFACYSEDRAHVVEYLIGLPDSPINQRDKSSDDTPLHAACQEMNPEAVAHLLQRDDLDINATNKSGNSALHDAVWMESCDIVNALLRHPFIIIDQRNHDNETPYDLVDYQISELQNRDDEYENDNQNSLQNYDQIKTQLEDHLVTTRRGSYAYFYRNCEDWSVNQEPRNFCPFACSAPTTFSIATVCF